MKRRGAKPDPHSFAGRLAEAVRCSGRREFTPREWMSLVASVVETREQRTMLSNDFIKRGYVERVVRVREPLRRRMAGDA